jgi:hypothetical protein
MIFHFSVFFISLLFVFLLEGLSLQNTWFSFMMVGLVILSVQSARHISKSFVASFMPLLFALSSGVLLALIDSPRQQQYFIMLSASVYFLIFLGMYRLRAYAQDQTARAMMAFATMATAFIFYSSLYGIYLNFAVSLWWLMALYGLGTMALSTQYFLLAEQKNRQKVRLYSAVLGLSLAEIAWIISFWPFGYLTAGVLVFIIYFILWDLCQSYFLGILSKKRVAIHLILFAVLAGMVLMSTQWVPLV